MCPLCLAASCLYVAGGLSAGGATTFLAAKVLRKRPDEGDDHATTGNRIDRSSAAVPDQAGKVKRDD
jgi:hypothetical protein